MRFIFPVMLLLSGNCLFAQLSWEDVSASFGALPKSVHIYRTDNSLNGRPFIAYYAEIKIKDKRILFSTDTTRGRRITPYQFYIDNREPVIVVNGSFFSFETNQNLNVVVNRGNMLSYNIPALKSRITDEYYYPTRSAIGITRRRKADVAWIFTDTANQRPIAFQERPILSKGKIADPSIYDLRTIDRWKYWKVRTAIGGGPVLVQDGKVKITNKEEQMFLGGESDLHPRTAMGYTDDGKLVILVIEGRNPGKAEGATLEELAAIFVSLKCKEALNLDGGGSSMMLVNGKETIQPSDKNGQRAVPAVFMVSTRK